MNCWYCQGEKAAVAICHVCGRGLCKEHSHSNKFSSVVYCEKHK